jgi:hypothetical protein
MSRYFFDFRQADDHLDDSQGIELRDVEQAYLEAFKGAQDMWSELLRQRRDPRRCLFVVRSEGNEILFVLPFQEVIDCCTDARVKPLARTFEELIQTRNYAKRVRDEFRQEVQRTRQMMNDSHRLLKGLQSPEMA